MKTSVRLLLLLFGLVSVSYANTTATQDERTAQELAAAMRAFGRGNGGAIPFGDNHAVALLPEKAGLVVPNQGEFRDQWENPVQFLRCGDSLVAIILPGKVDDGEYLEPTCALVGGKPFDAKRADLKE